MSAVWRYFRISNDKSRDCKLCFAKLSRGVKNSAFNSSNLIKHLKNKHNAEFKELDNASSGKLHQPTLQQTLEKREKIVLEPKYEIPSHHITETVLPKLHDFTSTACCRTFCIAVVFDDMLKTWGLPKSAAHVVLRDNAKNMIKSMSDGGLPSLPCVTHTHQLAVNEGLLAQRSVADVVAVGRKIVGHFKHSAFHA
ncbi:hypothetical protein N1851_022856 [Merluccius polli]|uniref:BED-type domain-containing protein n=1 Tax=Merluccius polli TaxID=89951 RepID=A0AA47MH36_MERPO|nr:hypothetical protein N1851_022856 [Merluccius polli]